MIGWLTNLTAVHILRQLITTQRIVSTTNTFPPATGSAIRRASGRVRHFGTLNFAEGGFNVGFSPKFFLGGGKWGELRYDTPKQRKKVHWGLRFLLSATAERNVAVK